MTQIDPDQALPFCISCVFCEFTGSVQFREIMHFMDLQENLDFPQIDPDQALPFCISCVFCEFTGSVQFREIMHFMDLQENPDFQVKIQSNQVK